MCLPNKYCTHPQAQTQKIAHAVSLLQYTSFLNQSFGHDAIFPSSVYCVAFLHSPYCFLWLIFLLAFPAALVWVSRLPVGFQNNSSCQPSFLPASPLPPDPPSSSIHHSTAHFTVPLCLLPPSVSPAPLPHSFVSPSSHPLPVQPADMNSFYPLTVFPSSSLHFSAHHSSSGPLSIFLPLSLPPSPPLCQALLLLFIRLAVERLHSCWQCCLCELSAELHSPLASHSTPHHHHHCCLSSSYSTLPPSFPPASHLHTPPGAGINLPASGCWA